MKTLISVATILIMFLTAAAAVVLAIKEAPRALPALEAVEAGTPAWQAVRSLGMPRRVDTFLDSAGMPMRRCDYGSFLVYIRGGLVVEVFYLEKKEGLHS